MFHRRGFLRSIAASAAAAALPHPNRLQEIAHHTPPPLPDPSLYDHDEEAYFAALRKQFLIPEDEVYLNNGTVGSSPLPVLHAIMDSYHDTECLAQHDPEDYPIWGYAATSPPSREWFCQPSSSAPWRVRRGFSPPSTAHTFPA